MPQLNIKSIIRTLLCTLALLAGVYGLTPTSAEAATITVCASGCTYLPTALQTAINNAVAGDVILLQELITYADNYVLRQKSCAANNATCYITIRTGVTSTGATIATSNYPATGIRIPFAQGRLATITATGNNVIPIRTSLPGETGNGCGTPCVSSWWKLQWVKIVSNSYAGNALLSLGNNDISTGLPAGDTQDSLADEPHDFLIDQVIFAGSPVIGQERAIQISARNVTVQNSYINNIKAIADKAAIWTDNSSGNITLTNNYVEGGTENFIAGGDVPRMNTDTTVSASPAPTTTSFAIAVVKDYLAVGQGLSVVVSGVKRYTHVTNIAGSTLTVEALPAAPVSGAAVNYSVVPHGLTVTKNYFYKPPSWMGTILSTPQSVTASGAITGGTLAAGTYSYKVTAGLTVAGGQVIRSTASAEVNAPVDTGTTGAVTVSWTAVPNAAWYFIYGRSAGGENVRQYTTSTSFTDTGTAASGTCGTTTQTSCTQSVPSSVGNSWMMKNLFEVKKMYTALVEGNVFDYSWQSGQTGFCTLFTVLNNSSGTDGNDSAVVRDLTVRNNKYRHCVAAFQLSGIAADGDISDRTRDVSITNNIFEDLGTAWGAKENIVIHSTGTNAAYTGTGNRGPLNILVDHNTFLNAQGKAGPEFDLYKAGEQNECQNCDYTNNIFRRNDYGLRNIGPAGLETEGNTSWVNGTDGASTWSNNVMVGATCSAYPGAPSATYCPDETTFQAAFVNYAAGNFRIKSTSALNTASSTGGAVGANIDTIEGFTTIALSGDNSGGGTPAVAPTVTTTAFSNATKGTPYTATLLASGGTTPYTWSVESGSTLPTGLSLSAGGVLSGTPTAAGSTTFSVRVTGANAAFSVRELTLTVIEILTPTERPARVDYMEIGFFRRAVEPDCLVDQVRVGDLYYNLSDGGVYKATATAPTCVWAPVGTAMTARNYMFDAGGANYSVTIATGAGNQFTSSQDIFADLTGITECRVWTRTNAMVSSIAWVKYNNTDFSTTPTGDLGTSANTPQAALSTLVGGTFAVGAWTPIVSGAKTFVRLSLWFKTSEVSAETDSALRNSGMTCR